MFLDARRQGLSEGTIKYYESTLGIFASEGELTVEGINTFLSSLKCQVITKHSYYRAIRAFCNFLHRNEYTHKNPIVKVDAPKPKRESYHR